MIKSLLLKTIKGKPLTIWVEGQTRGLLEKFQIRTLPFNYIDYNWLFIILLWYFFIYNYFDYNWLIIMLLWYFFFIYNLAYLKSSIFFKIRDVKKPQLLFIPEKYSEDEALVVKLKNQDYSIIFFQIHKI
jgi:hypothetical protein